MATLVCSVVGLDFEAAFFSPFLLTTFPGGMAYIDTHLQPLTISLYDVAAVELLLHSVAVELLLHSVAVELLLLVYNTIIVWQQLNYYYIVWQLNYYYIAWQLNYYY